MRPSLDLQRVILSLRYFVNEFIGLVFVLIRSLELCQSFGWESNGILFIQKAPTHSWGRLLI